MKQDPGRPLREYAVGFYDGPHATPPECSEGPIFLRIDNITPRGRLDLTELRFISEQDFPRWTRRVQPQEGDVVISYEATLHRYALIPPGFHGCLGRRLALMRPKLGVADPAFVLYYFLSPQWKQIAAPAILNGATVDRLSLLQLPNLIVKIPPLSVQRRVAHILSSYDDLLENNARRIRLLEESARLLYEEWFVRLRFPGHEHTPIQNAMPKGWQHVPTPEAVDINPRTKLSDEDEHWWVQMGDLPLNSMVIQSAIKRSGRSGSKFMNGDTLLARITPCLENGKTAFVAFMQPGEVGRGSTEFIVLRSRTLTPEYVYCLARTYAFRHNAIKSMIGASGRQRVQESCFEKFLVYVPPKTLLDAFTDFARPAFRQIQTLHMQNQKLQQARDLLLPRLMNGEIAV